MQKRAYFCLCAYIVYAREEESKKGALYTVLPDYNAAGHLEHDMCHLPGARAPRTATSLADEELARVIQASQWDQ